MAGKVVRYIGFQHYSCMENTV